MRRNYARSRTDIDNPAVPDCPREVGFASRDWLSSCVFSAAESVIETDTCQCLSAADVVGTRARMIAVDATTFTCFVAVASFARSLALATETQMFTGGKKFVVILKHSFISDAQLMYRVYFKK